MTNYLIKEDKLFTCSINFFLGNDFINRVGGQMVPQFKNVVIGPSG